VRIEHSGTGIVVVVVAIDVVVGDEVVVGSTVVVVTGSVLVVARGAKVFAVGPGVSDALRQPVATAATAARTTIDRKKFIGE